MSVYQSSYRLCSKNCAYSNNRMNIRRSIQPRFAHKSWSLSSCYSRYCALNSTYNETKWQNILFWGFSRGRDDEASPFFYPNILCYIFKALNDVSRKRAQRYGVSFHSDLLKTISMESISWQNTAHRAICDRLSPRGRVQGSYRAQPVCGFGK